MKRYQYNCLHFLTRPFKSGTQWGQGALAHQCEGKQKASPLHSLNGRCRSAVSAPAGVRGLLAAISSSLPPKAAKQSLLKGFVFMALSIAMLGLLGACGSSNQNQVHMNETSFVEKSITIQKGESVTLVNDSPAIHVIENGSWVDGMQLPKDESGAPQIHASVDGNVSQIIGPFNTAGTFHLYCTVHPDMNLTVIVR